MEHLVHTSGNCDLQHTFFLKIVLFQPVKIGEPYTCTDIVCLCTLVPHHSLAIYFRLQVLYSEHVCSEFPNFGWTTLWFWLHSRIIFSSFYHKKKDNLLFLLLWVKLPVQTKKKLPGRSKLPMLPAVCRLSCLFAKALSWARGIKI